MLYYPVFLLLLLSAFAAGPKFVAAESPPLLPGWSSTGYDVDGSEHPGIVLNGSAVGSSAPAIAEVDGSEANGNEVVVVTADATLSVYGGDGSPRWFVQLPNYGCTSSSARVYASPAVGALFGDGVPYVVAGYGGLRKECDGGVAVYRGSDGTLLWNFSLRTFAAKNGFRENFAGVFSTPALADTDRDGKLEIGFGGLDRHIYLLEANGAVRWYYQAADTVFSSPAFANIDTNPDLEMIIGTDISQNLQMRPVIRNGGMVYALRTARPRTRSKLYSFRSKAAYVWALHLDQTVQSSPLVADVLRSNPGPEIVVGSGCYFPEGTTAKGGRWIKVIRPKDGRVLRTLTTPACLPSSPAVGDINDDGTLEIVATVSGAKSLGGDGYSRVLAWSATSPDPIWSTIPNEGGDNDPFGGNFQSPVVADLDGNGSLEVIASNGARVSILNGRDGTPLTCQEETCDDGGPVEVNAGYRLRSTPAVADVNGDGVLDLVVAGGFPLRSGRGGLFGWTSFQERLGSPSGIHPPFATPWPQFRGGPTRGGALR
jgi:hypothetical protein